MNTFDILAAVLSPEDVLLNAGSSTKDEIMDELAGHAARRLERPRSEILDALRRRENLGTTGIGGGVALPHASLTDLSEPFATFALLAAPVDFGSADGLPVDVVFLLLTPPGRPGEHLKILSAVARRCRDQAALDCLRKVQTKAAARDCLLAQGQED